MKVSIDNILGSAQQINSRMRPNTEGSDKTTETKHNDQVHINSNVDRRIGQLESDLRTIQSSISMQQVTLDGMRRLREDLMTGGANQQEILNNTVFEGKTLLSEFAVGQIDLEMVTDRMNNVTTNIDREFASLKKMLVEVDNIIAADMLSAQRANELTAGLQTEIAKDASIAGITSNLNAVNVRNLIG